MRPSGVADAAAVAAKATFQYDVEFPVVPPARTALSAQRSRENHEHSPAARRKEGAGRRLAGPGNT